MNKILIIGSGELGHEIITSLLQHPEYTPSTHKIAVTIRPSTLTDPTRQHQFSKYKDHGISITPLNIETDALETLTSAFSQHTTVIHAGGMTLTPGTQLKVTRAALASTTGLYVPWQFGLDYDLTGPEVGDGLFAEQVEVRRLLRSQDRVDWLIVSTGVFTSFLFEEAWGVFRPPSPSSSDGNADGDRERCTVTALGDWTSKLAATTAGDIGRCTASLLLEDTHLRNRPVFIAGDSVTYAEVADVVARVTGSEVERRLWTTEQLTRESEREPDNKLLKYRVVFSRHVGTSWADGVEVYNERKGFDMVGVEEWFRAFWERRMKSLNGGGV